MRISRLDFNFLVLRIIFQTIVNFYLLYPIEFQLRTNLRSSSHVVISHASRSEVRINRTNRIMNRSAERKLIKFLTGGAACTWSRASLERRARRSLSELHVHSISILSLTQTSLRLCIDEQISIDEITWKWSMSITLVRTCLFFSTMPSFYSLKDDIDQVAATMNNSRRLTIKLYRSIRPVRLLNRVVTNKMVSLR